MTEVEYLSDYSEMCESDDEENYEPPPKRRRSCNRPWTKSEEFGTGAEAEAAVAAKNIWSKCSTNACSDGVKVEYRCAAGQYRRNECPARLYILYHSDSAAASIFHTDCEHANHSNTPVRGLPFEMKQFIREKFDEGIRKPNAIIAAMRMKKMAEPSKAKLRSYLQQVRTEKLGQATVSANEIRKLCEANKEVPADDEDAAFVVDYFLQAESPAPEEQCLRIVISTRRLLRNLRLSDMVQIDATYKVNWQGYPVMVVGTTDRNKTFHPFALAICNGETAEDFAFIFCTLHTFNPEWKPVILLADGAEAITRGFEEVFGPPQVRLMCYFHVLKNVEKYLKVIRGSTSVALKHDITTLQACQDETSFQKAAVLFFKKWGASEDPQVADFMDYFRAQWVDKNNAWFEGAALGQPSTNNGLEATNAVIKREHTLRERLPLGHFFHSAKELVAKWSTSRNPASINCICYAAVRSPSLKHWTTAYQWATANKKVLLHDDGVYYTTSTTSTTEMSKQLLRKMEKKNGKWKTFAEFKEYRYGLWAMKIDRNLENSTCSCPVFCKELICKHVLGMLIRLHLCDVPTEAKNIPLGQKRKRGRPSKAKKALIIQ